MTLLSIIPVWGVNLSLVEATLTVVALPVVTDVKIGYRGVAVVVSSAIVTPEASLDQVGTPLASFRT
jgi:hypothetical protein